MIHNENHMKLIVLLLLCLWVIYGFVFHSKDYKISIIYIFILLALFIYSIISNFRFLIH